MKNNNFSNHISRLKLEAIVKSTLAGLAVGFGANFVTALVIWFLPFPGLWISLGVFGAVSIVAGILFYLKRYRPTDMRNARRLDSMGLYERMITMVEYENDPSTIAKIQREDAKKALASIDKKQIKINISRTLAVLVITFTVLGLGMTTVTALGDYGIMPDGNQIIENMLHDATLVHYSVSYIANEGGTIEGDEEQLVPANSDTEAVTAVADDGFMFVGWSDGVTTQTRYETCVKEDAVYYAKFIELDEFPDGETDLDDGDSDPNAPHRTPENGEEKPESSNGDPQDAPEGGGKYEPNNQIIDGSTYYRELLELYKEAANDRIQDGSGKFSNEEIEFIKKYLGIV